MIILKSTDRKRFLKDTTTVRTISMPNKDVIGDLKFIGRQYGCLADMMNQLNCCYSFQVKKRLCKLNVLSIWNFEFTLDDDQYRIHICSLHIHFLHNLSKIFENGWSLRMFNANTCVLDNSLFSRNTDGYPFGCSS